MEEPSTTPSPEGKAFSDSAVDFDLMDELLSGDCWLDSSNYSDFLQPSTSTAPFSSSSLFASLYEAINNGSASTPIPSQFDVQDADLDPSLNEAPIGSSQLEPSSDWSILPRSPIFPIKERLFLALKHIKDAQTGGEVLVQIWVPTTTRRGNKDKQFLTTSGQPFWFEPNCQSLAKYRSVSTEFQFSAEANSSDLLGLPGRVFIGKVPEWTPDVRYFSVEEYLRVDQAQRLNVSGTIALPVFERDSQSCIGVVEVVLTTQKINYSSHVENICKALQAVNLRSSDVLRVPRVKVSDKSYQAALPEIRDVLKTVCETHSLPLAQTWIACVRQGKRGSRHSSENYKECVSTVDSACYVNDPSMFGFLEACSEHHLFKGQGLAGKAFTTNEPCFSPDITSFIKTQYPLSHHAKLFHLRAAVAIRLRSIHTGNADFVLEFFLPVNCVESEEQKQMLNSLSITIQQVCRSLRVVTAKELDEEVMAEVNPSFPSVLSFDKFLSEGGQWSVDENILSVCSPSVQIRGEVPSWLEVQEKGKSSEQVNFTVSADWDASESALPDGRIFSEFKDSQSSADQRSSFSSKPSCQRAGKATEKRRAKTEKSVSLEVLRKYFAGSLKDAAKSLGVCPTTLKRICRQHGITRWPSRKIKKVGHSLKKLQVVIDSVQGAEGTFQFSSVYESFTKVSSPQQNSSGSYKTTTTKQTDQPESSNLHQQRADRFSPHTVSNSSSSTCSLSSNASLGCSTGSMQQPHALQFAIKEEAPVEENQAAKLVRANSELNIPSREAQRAIIRSQSHEALVELPSRDSYQPQLLKRRSEDSFQQSPSQLLKRRSDVFKVKAVYGEEKVRFRLHPTWGFQELKQETVKRFNISDICSVDLKYLDDDSEWVLLTCNADLQECIDVYKSSSCDTIKITVNHTALPVSRGSFGLQGLS